MSINVKYLRIPTFRKQVTFKSLLSFQLAKNLKVLKLLIESKRLKKIYLRRGKEVMLK